MGFDMGGSHTCEICGKSRHARNVDHSACSKERQRRHEVARDTPLGRPGVPTITRRQMETGRRNATNRAIKAAQEGTAEPWRPK